MFQSTRIKLTLWYLLIIMTISILFSLFIYSNIDAEFQRFERIQIERERVLDDLPLPLPPGVHRPHFNPEIIKQARIRVLTTLGIINFIILIISGLAGYFLAGRTLRPIKKMIDEQNRFISDSSHELRTPLTALRSEIEVGLRNKKLTIDNAKHLLNSNLEEVINLQSLSDNLLELTQFEKPNRSLQFTKFHLSECSQTAEKKLESIAKKKNITIHNNIHNYEILGEKQSIIELFVILIDNAIKYSPRKSNIVIDNKKMDKHISISIKDHGYGIEAEDIPHIFDRFYRASKSRSKQDISGYGLGLSIAKKIIDIHHGSISVESIVGKGSTFTVQLPFVQ